MQIQTIFGYKSVFLSWPIEPAGGQQLKKVVTRVCGVFNDVNGSAQLVYSGTERRQWLSYDCSMKSST